MSIKNYENGIVGSSESGHEDITTDIIATGVVIYVDSVNGDNANAGTNRDLPKATLASAISVATANNGDIIIIESGHTETLSSSLVIATAGISIYGLGSGTSKPQFTVSAAVIGIDVNAARVRLHNLYFPAGITTNNTARVHFRAVNCAIFDSDFLCGLHDPDSIQVVNAGDDAEVNGCSFTVTADGPGAGINVIDATMLGLKVVDCSFDGGAFDWDNGAIYSPVAHTEFRYEGNTLVNHASIIHTAAAKGLCIGTVAGDGSRVQV